MNSPSRERTTVQVHNLAGEVPGGRRREEVDGAGDVFHLAVPLRHRCCEQRLATLGGEPALEELLTTAGHDLIERTVDQVLRGESELVASLSPTGRTQLAAQLQELLDEVAERARQPSPGRGGLESRASPASVD